MSPDSRSGKAQKRAMDLILGVPALLLSLPLQTMVALLVRVSSRGPILYRSRRVGCNGIEFTMLKFRTMRTGVPGIAVTAKGDHRITSVGRLLRSTKLDELPQLFQVVRGTMSLVGRRPEDPIHRELYTPEQEKVLRLPPAITGPAMVVDEESILVGTTPEEVHRHYVEQIMPAKVAANLRYLENWSLRCDITILLKTVVVMTPIVGRVDRKRRAVHDR
jgi:lipopolysaccharide/colanic/teichoic acid biosynthesis glycosyltransferase